MNTFMNVRKRAGWNDKWTGFYVDMSLGVDTASGMLSTAKGALWPSANTISDICWIEGFLLRVMTSWPQLSTQHT